MSRHGRPLQGIPSDNGGVNLSDLLATFPPNSAADVDALDDALLPTVARVLEEEPTRDAVSARSPELLPLIEDLLADWHALALADLIRRMKRRAQRAAKK